MTIPYEFLVSDTVGRCIALFLIDSIFKVTKATIFLCAGATVVAETYGDMINGIITDGYMDENGDCIEKVQSASAASEEQVVRCVI